MSVEEVWAGIADGGESVGRTTVYRGLEAMARDGAALKVTMPGGEARYRIAGDGAEAQLVCLGCGRVLPLDCRMVSEFSTHVLEHHGFAIDAQRTVLYGRCNGCREGR